MLIRFLAAMILMSTQFEAASQPGTEIFLFDLKKKQGVYRLENGRNITNRPGYDNQPFFHPDKPLLFFVAADGDGRTDIFKYDYETDVQTQVTRTSEREYSPTVTPDKKYISCIIQKDDGAQDLGRYPIDGGAAEILIDNLVVGYHAWIDDDRLAVFVLPRPFRLHLVDLTKDKDTVMAQDIGRSLNRVPGTEAISFVQKDGDEWTIRKLDGETGTMSVLTKSISTAEHDMTWTPNGYIIMSDGNKLYYWSPESEDGTWTEITFREDRPSQSISRIAVSADGRLIALVINE